MIMMTQDVVSVGARMKKNGSCGRKSLTPKSVKLEIVKSPNRDKAIEEYRHNGDLKAALEAGGYEATPDNAVMLREWTVTENGKELRDLFKKRGREGARDYMVGKWWDLYGECEDADPREKAIKAKCMENICKILGLDKDPEGEGGPRTFEDLVKERIKEIEKMEKGV